MDKNENYSPKVGDEVLIENQKTKITHVDNFSINFEPSIITSGILYQINFLGKEDFHKIKKI